MRSTVMTLQTLMVQTKSEIHFQDMELFTLCNEAHLSVYCKLISDYIYNHKDVRNIFDKFSKAAQPQTLNRTKFSQTNQDTNNQT